MNIFAVSKISETHRKVRYVRQGLYMNLNIDKLQKRSAAIDSSCHTRPTSPRTISHQKSSIVLVNAPRLARRLPS